MNFYSFAQRSWKGFISYVIFASLAIYFAGSIGAWVVASVTQMMLILVNLHSYILVSDMVTYTSQSRIGSCRDCNFCFKLELVLMIFNTALIFYLDTSYWMSVVYFAAVIVEVVAYTSYITSTRTYIHCLFSRHMDATTAYQSARRMSNINAGRLGFNFLMFVACMMYLGPLVASVGHNEPMMLQDDWDYDMEMDDDTVR
eukprot:Tbor_TRINITY_DN5657_c5_g3::TRINITY_DN5657_c5_g3_i2::g.9456::m.9456